MSAIQDITNIACFTDVITFLEDRKKLELREINSKFGNNIIPRSFTKYSIDVPCDEDDEEPNEFYKVLTAVRDLSLMDIRGDKKSAEFINQIGEKFGKKCSSLYLNFFGEYTDENEAENFVNGLKKFETVEKITIEAYSEGNIGCII
jgi:hypothetical protein